jgi:hypothetical protein
LGAKSRQTGQLRGAKNQVNGIADIVARIFNDPNKVKHIFHPKHNIDKLGSPSEALEKVTKAVLDASQAGGNLPPSGPFTYNNSPC